VSEAQKLREQIQGLAASDNFIGKERLWHRATQALTDVRLIGDLVVSAFFQREKPKERQALRATYVGKIQGWLSGGDASELKSIADELRVEPHPIPPFHWEIEFPEVFSRANSGFDVFVGNPPFAGKNTLANATRENYPVWLQTLHSDSHGNADLVAHFYRRAFNRLRNDGTFGLIATNTIAQGDTRSTGLRWIRMHNGTIFAARKRIKWPGDAAVIVSVVHINKGPLSGPFDLDGRSVDNITAFLFHAGRDEDPKPLLENANKTFQGSILLGSGFTFDDTVDKGLASPTSLMRGLIRKDPRNAERVFPYIGGEEVNTSPTHAYHRFAINFGQLSEDQARLWPDLMSIVEARVRPQRQEDNREGYRKYWWLYAEKRKELYEAIEGLKKVLVRSLTSTQYQTFTFLPGGYVYDQTLIVFATSSTASFCALCSRIHEAWALFFGATMKDDPRYNIARCFETFPFPERWESSEDLERTGRECYDFRAALMVRNGEGLTKTYNRFHDPYEHSPDIQKLRDLHAAIDRAVLDAYGWTDIQPRCEFILDYEDEEDETPGKPSKKRKPWRYRWPDEIRDEVLARLLDLNAERAEEEKRAGAAFDAAIIDATAKKKRNRGKATRTPLLD
jgi:hypothetical protein